MFNDTVVVLLSDREYEDLVWNLKAERCLYETGFYKPGEYLADRLRKLRQALWNLA